MSLQTQQSSTLADSFRATPEAAKLWMMFRERVDPVARLSFSWTLERLQSAVSDQSLYKKLTAGERALIVASCYFGVVSLTKDECLAECGISKPDMLTAYRYHCEQSLIHINILTISDMESLKALCLYVVSRIDQRVVKAVRADISSAESECRHGVKPKLMVANGSCLPQRRTTGYSPRR